MRVLTVYAHPDPTSFCHAILQQFTKGLQDAGHASVDGQRQRSNTEEVRHVRHEAARRHPGAERR